MKFKEIISGTVKNGKHCSTWDSLLKKYPKTNIRALSKKDSTVRDFRIVHSDVLK